MKVLKKGLVPELRFPEFSGEWEDEKLSAIVDRVTTRNSNNESDHVLTISAEMGLIDQKEYFNKRVASKDLKNYYLIYKNSFAYNKSYSNGYPYGVIKRLNRYEKGVLSSLYICFKSKYDNHIYLEHYFESSKWYKEIYKIAVEGARNHGLLNIGIQDFFDIGIKHPQLEEQEKIANFFTLIGGKIEKQEEKIANLEDYKKGMLQKLFPKKGESIPELRFRGFTDPWEQRKLEDVAKYRNGKAHENDISESGKYIVINSKFVSTNGEVKKYSESQIEPLYENEIAFVLSDVPNGRAIARTFIVDKDDKYTLNQRIAGITPHNVTSPYFLYILMNRNKYFLKFDDGSKQTNLSLNDVLEFKELYPNYEEQQKIGQFFTNLDNLITLHQSKLEELKELKKGFMQNMFI